MSYCVNCGVELDSGVKKCPLCGTDVINPNEHVCNPDPPYPVYKPEPKQKVNRGTVVTLLTLLFMLPVFLTFISDFSINKRVTWSSFVIGSVIFVYLIVLFSVIFNEHPALRFSLISVDIAGFLLFIELSTKGKWFLTFALPITTAIAVFVIAMILLNSEKKISALTTVACTGFFAGAYCVLIELLINVTFKIRDVLAWSFYPFITFSILSIALLCIQKNKPLLEKIEKKFFL